MACWSPSDAMNAYTRTLQLWKDYYYDEEMSASKLIEPTFMEYISALAAGNRARLIVDIGTGGMSPSILALAAAARQTGGRLLCLRRDQAEAAELRREIQGFDLGDVVECRAGRPADVAKQLENVDFAVIDHGMEDWELVSVLDMNHSGSAVVVCNLYRGRSGEGVPATASYGQLLKKRASAGVSVRTVLLPFGGGMEVTRIGRSNHKAHNRGSRRKFVVYYE